MTEAAVGLPPLTRTRRILENLNIDRWLMPGLVLLAALWMVVVVLLPLYALLSKSVLDQSGTFVGLDNFVRYFRTPALSLSLYNSLFVSLATTAISVTLGFVYAYALTRTTIPGRTFFRSVAMLPLFAPTLLYGITLVYLFGRKGLVTTGFFGFWERLLGLNLGVDIGVYGPVGIIIAEVLFTFPQAMLILSVALGMTDARLYEAADSLRASRVRTFFTITLPGIKYGLISATFVCFILSFTDFGAPKTVGGNYNVLATDIYKQVIGQQNFVMGATVSVILLIPTVVAFLLDRISQRKQVALIAAKSVPLTPKPQRLRDGVFLVFCSLIALLLIGLFATAVLASLVKVWPYDLSMGLGHYDFRNVGGGGYAAFFNSLRMAAYTAVIGTAVTFASAYLIEKSTGVRWLRQGAYFLSTLPLALPGLVIGLSYIFFFNAPSWQLLGVRLPNPLNVLYGTMGILVVCNIVHFYTVSFLTATTALKQLDREFEAVSLSLAVPFYKTFLRVTVPVCLPAILEITMYYFVNSMATVSGVIFLYSADLPLASVAVANMDDAGDIASAAAMSVLIVLANMAARLLYGVLTKGVQKRTQAWIAA
jgi:iron(III) transport system permease protein